jgi:hypothetical protein
MKTDKSIKNEFVTSVKNAGSIFQIVIEVVLVVALIPVVKTFIAGMENLTGTETLLLSLITLFIVLGLIWNTIKLVGLK